MNKKDPFYFFAVEMQWETRRFITKQKGGIKCCILI